MFFPIPAGTAIAPPEPETTQRTLADLSVWAAGLRPVYMEGSLARAIAVEEEPFALGQLAAAEYDALEDAELLETSAAIKRTAADLDDAAANAALDDAERLRRERISTEESLAATEQAVATLEAEAHEQEARKARVVAAEAGTRIQSAHDAAERPSRGRPAAAKKK